MGEIARITMKESCHGRQLVKFEWLGENPTKVSIEVAKDKLSITEVWDIVQLLVEHARMEVEA